MSAGSAEIKGLHSCSHMLQEPSSQKSIKVQVRAQGGLVETAGWPLASVAERWRLQSSETHPRSASLTAQDPPNYLLQLPVEVCHACLGIHHYHHQRRYLYHWSTCTPPDLRVYCQAPRFSNLVQTHLKGFVCVGLPTLCRKHRVSWQVEHN